MRCLALDLGVKRCGLAISDKSNKISLPMDLISYKFEDYDYLEKEINKIIKEKEITDVIIGLPKNMDGTEGFASMRSKNFADRFKNIKVHLVDERLTTIMAHDKIHEIGKNEKNAKNIIDSISACIILDAYLKELNNGRKNDN